MLNVVKLSFIAAQCSLTHSHSVFKISTITQLKCMPSSSPLISWYSNSGQTLCSTSAVVFGFGMPLTPQCQWNVVIHLVQIWLVWWPIILGDEVHIICLKPACSVSWSSILEKYDSKCTQSSLCFSIILLQHIFTSIFCNRLLSQKQSPTDAMTSAANSWSSKRSWLESVHMRIQHWNNYIKIGPRLPKVSKKDCVGVFWLMV